MRIFEIISESVMPKPFYHGSSKPISKFTDEFVGRGNDQYGAGIYFTDNIETAKGYGDNLYKCRLDIDNPLTSKTPIDEDIIMTLIEESEDEIAWTNWSDNHYEAVQMGFDSVINSSDNMYEAILSVWADWYMNDPVVFVRKLVHYGYDAAIIPVRNGETFVVVYDPRCIVHSVLVDEDDK